MNEICAPCAAYTVFISAIGQCHSHYVLVNYYKTVGQACWSEHFQRIVLLNEYTEYGNFHQHILISTILGNQSFNLAKGKHLVGRWVFHCSNHPLDASCLIENHRTFELFNFHLVGQFGWHFSKAFIPTDENVRIQLTCKIDDSSHLAFGWIRCKLIIFLPWTFHVKSQVCSILCVCVSSFDYYFPAEDFRENF